MSEGSAPIVVSADATFAVVPTWVIRSSVSDRAVRLYALLRRYTDATGEAWPSKETLARDLRCDKRTVDRAMLELVDLGAILIEERWHRGQQTSNLYRLHSTPVRNPVERGGGTGATPGRGDTPGGGVGATLTRAIERKDPPTPASGGARTICKTHKRPRRGCTDCSVLAPVRPGHCGTCDPTTRLVEQLDGRVTRCSTCHPLAVR